MKTNHRQDCIISAQTEMDEAEKEFLKTKEKEGIVGSWLIGSGTASLNQAYRRFEKAEAVYNAVLYALNASSEYAEKITDAYNRYCQSLTWKVE